MSVLGRLGAVAKVLASHRDQPAVRGRAARIAGTALIADGLVGLENPLGKQSRSGILGGAVLLGIGVVLLGPAASLGEGLGPYADGTIVPGMVSSVGLPDGDGSGGSCSLRFTYELAGVTYERTPSWSSSGFCDRVVGDRVDVSVRPEDPARGRLASEGATTLATWVPRAPWLLVIAGAWTVVVRAVEIVVGIWLVLLGRRIGRDAPEGSDELVLGELKRAWAGGSPADAAGTA